MSATLFNINLGGRQESVFSIFTTTTTEERRPPRRNLNLFTRQLPCHILLTLAARGSPGDLVKMQILTQGTSQTGSEILHFQEASRRC